MNYQRIFSFAITLIVSSVAVWGQNFFWKGKYEFIMDNREYSSYYGFPETILGVRGSGEIGYQIDTNQSLVVGGSYLLIHGADVFEKTPVLTLYYEYKTPHLRFQVGSFPIENPTFDKVLYTDSLIYFRPNYQGARAIYSNKFTQQTVLFDWHTLENFGYCEKFIAGVSGITHLGNFYVNDMLYYRHHAEGVRGSKSVADNVGASLMLGYDFKNTWFDSLSVASGFVYTMYSNKRDTTIVSPQKSWASYSKLHVHKKFIGLDATYYYGGETHLPWGDPLYRCGNYARIDGILYLLKRNNVNFDFRFCVHGIDGEWNTSQQVFITANIGSKR